MYQYEEELTAPLQAEIAQLRQQLAKAEAALAVSARLRREAEEELARYLGTE